MLDIGRLTSTRMQKSIVETTSAKQTRSLGASFGASLLLSVPRKRALVVALKGELGAGKTTFVQGIAKGLGVQEKILSPTFVVVKSYPVLRAERMFYHIDCYRVERVHDLVVLGWGEIVEDMQNIVVIEWPERIQALLPRNRIKVEFTSKGVHERTITFN